MSDSLTVTAPAGYAVSTTTIGTYSSTLTLGADSLGTLDTTIFIAMDGTAPATNPTQVTLSSTGATDVLIPVSGTTGGALTVRILQKRILRLVQQKTEPSALVLPMFLTALIQ